MLQATVKQADGYLFVGRSNSGHWVPMDGSTKIGALDGAARPKELLLLALGGCTAFDVEMVLKKRRVQAATFEVLLEADEVDETPMVFSQIRVTYRFTGEIAVAELERAIKLSEEKYCSVSAMMRKAVPISWTAELNGEQVLTDEGRA